MTLLNPKPDFTERPSTIVDTLGRTRPTSYTPRQTSHVIMPDRVKTPEKAETWTSWATSRGTYGFMRV